MSYYDELFIASVEQPDGTFQLPTKDDFIRKACSEVDKLRNQLARARQLHEQEVGDLRDQLAASKTALEQARGRLEASSGLLRLVGTTWTDESDAHKMAHREADANDNLIARIDAAKGGA